jgi:ABC-2 type transport system ATP-binding protein
MILQVDNLTKRFGEFTAVDRVSMSIDRGELVGIIGPDGAGKTTFMRMLAGALNPTEGNIVINGKIFHKDRQELKEEIGYLSQVSQAYGDLTVWENIEFFGKIRKVRNWQSRGEELLEFARLNDFKDRLCDQLSGGMRQKLGVCCSVIHQPKLLILDEPTTGVDPVSRRELWLILANFLKHAMTILVSTPYLNEAERCNRVALFNEGKLLRFDTVSNLTSQTSLHVYEVHSKNLGKAYSIVSKLDFVGNAMILGDRINFVTNHSSEKDLDSVLAAIRNGADGRAEMKEIGASLDNIFTSLIKS